MDAEHKALIDEVISCIKSQIFVFKIYYCHKVTGRDMLVLIGEIISGKIYQGASISCDGNNFVIDSFAGINSRNKPNLIGLCVKSSVHIDLAGKIIRK